MSNPFAQIQQFRANPGQAQEGRHAMIPQYGVRHFVEPFVAPQRHMHRREPAVRPECRYFKPSVHGFYGTVKNFTEGRKGHEACPAAGRGKNPPSRSALRATAGKPAEPAGLQSWSLNPTHSVPDGARWAPPAAVIEPLRSSRPSVNGLRF
jgi:hypothetical protein